ncbi:MAG: nucleotide exchange factor GrpE [Flavobacteriales bacterium]
MSEEKDALKDDLQQDPQEETTATESTEEQTEETPKEPTAEEKYAELNDRFLRLYAEFDNYRRRTNEERLQLISTASKDVLQTMLPVMDNFERAIATNENLEDVEAMKEGFHLIFNMFKGILESKGLKAMESKGLDFDSDLHEAIANIPAPDKKLVGKVIDDVEKGYYLNDKVIRFAKVVVGQ